MKSETLDASNRSILGTAAFPFDPFLFTSAPFSSLDFAGSASGFASPFAGAEMATGSATIWGSEGAGAAGGVVAGGEDGAGAGGGAEAGSTAGWGMTTGVGNAGASAGGSDGLPVTSAADEGGAGPPFSGAVAGSGPGCVAAAASGGAAGNDTGTGRDGASAIDPGV